ncbi:MAG: thiolase family protein [Yaniella sp.]|uniref:thiolase family protein n=1 Tax=Yaniella sp. TaxID=2773929 RepID=UPI002649C6B8|nr:thiolase family protein [Yaniella sp.]MDN5703976.1 thiolase family protein [Yaniella sp.]MDN5730994.1 thiolase family protein [Yaniella sp.]MDN5815202.1 thiolase family protein [Yaniella sp.]MDN5817002.1 thiolase family protein [Yaniella sp.]MDN5837985.1 thiolase family protein [Yaniella sp.]
MQQVYIYDALRTPFGRLGGGLAGVRPDDLAATVITKLFERYPNLDRNAIDDVVFGNANGAGEENRNVARMATLLAGLPTSIPGVTVNRLCGSSLDAAFHGSYSIGSGDNQLVITGGTESMSRAPYVMPKPERAYPAGNSQMVSTTLGWRLINPDMPKAWTVSLGEATEQLVEKYEVSRDRQDQYAALSHQRANAAWEAGHYDNLVVPIDEVTRDETIRPETTVDTLSGLRTVFRQENGTVTAGNASSMNDGAGVVLMGSEQAATTLGADPLVRVVSRGVAANEPQYFGEAPVPAANLALERAGITWDQIGAIELNEAFAAQVLVNLDSWGIALDDERVNAWGGAIALGHPLGASGSRVLGTLARRLKAENRRWGLAALCVGVGQGVAMVVENEDATE